MFLCDLVLSVQSRSMSIGVISSLWYVRQHKCAIEIKANKKITLFLSQIRWILIFTDYFYDRLKFLFSQKTVKKMPKLIKINVYTHIPYQTRLDQNYAIRTHGISSVF